ncbi:MAG: hypothetical protein H6610_11780 [Ignavibacteriales bacterium]|nr:hypothetical protein [Ignavibacteriales bacterium]
MFFTFFLFHSINIFSQLQPGAKQIALSHSDVASANNSFSLFTNPAGLSKIGKTQFGIFYSPSPFGMKELANGFITLSHPTSFGSFAVGAMNYGFELYKENRIHLGYSNIFAKRFLIGVSGMYQTLNIKNYGHAGFFNFSLGSIFLLTNKFAIGFVLNNPLRNKDYSPLTTNFRSGITYEIIKEAKIHLSVYKEINFPISVSSGVEYDVLKFFSLRFGIQNEPNIYSAGIGINYLFLNLNYAINSHQDLGMTHQIGLIINFTE